MQIISIFIFILVGIGVFELRAIRKEIARDDVMPHWVKKWLEDEEAKKQAREKAEAEIEYWRSALRRRKLKTSGNVPLNEDQIGNTQ